MPKELVSRGIEQPEQVCRAMGGALESFSAPEAAADSPEAVFKRLGGD